MSAKTILIEKQAFLDKLIADFERQYGQVAKSMLTTLKGLVGTVDWTYENIQTLFTEAGFDATASTFVEQFVDVIKYQKMLAEELQIPFAIGERGLDLAGLIQENELRRIVTKKDAIINDLIDAGLRHEVEGTGFNQLVADFQVSLEELGRRAATEVFTGISIFDRTIKSEQFKESGIELFYYAGPEDDKNRDACRDVLRDPRQDTGWTREDIAVLADVNFTTAGGYLCRHEWLPFVEEI
jgi:hypothetical protein